MGLGRLPWLRAETEATVICLRYVGGQLAEEFGWDPDRDQVIYEHSAPDGCGEPREATPRVVYTPHRIRWGAPNPQELVLFLAGGVEPDGEHLADVERWIRGRRP